MLLSVEIVPEVTLETPYIGQLEHWYLQSSIQNTDYSFRERKVNGGLAVE